MYKTFKKDYVFGKNEEDDKFDLIKKVFGNDLKKTNNFCKYDFFNDKYIIELKSRNNNYNKFATTLLPADKILKNIEQKQIFIFNFTDGLYYIEYDENKFNNYPNEKFVRNKRNDFNDLYKPYYYIPINDLIKI